MGEGVCAAPSPATCSFRCLPHSSLRHTFRLENTDAFFSVFSPSLSLSTYGGRLGTRDFHIPASCAVVIVRSVKTFIGE